MPVPERTTGFPIQALFYIIGGHLPQFVLLDFAAGRGGKLIDEIDEPGNFVIGDVVPAKVPDIVFVQGGPVFRLNEGGHLS
jgi:hypothetical protein